MVNNFKIIKDLLKFESKDQFYFLQIIQRKKDHKEGQKVNGSNNNSRLIKAYYVKSLEHFEFIMPEVIQLCEVFNARAGINLNRRSFERMSLQLLRKVTDQIMNKSFDKAYKAYSSVVGAHHNETDKMWILDIDEELSADSAHNLIEYIRELQPNPGEDKTILFIPSRAGHHLITRPFNLKDFKEEYPEIEVHKNNPTNLYIP